MAALLALAPSATAQAQLAELSLQHLPVERDVTTAVAAGDVDGDGDADLVVANSGTQNRLYVNDGAGTFSDATATRMPADTDLSAAVALGDVDADGDLDILLGNAGRQNRLYLNDGTGTFTDATAARMPVDADVTQAVALADVDGDARLDVVIGNINGQARLYRNDGAGSFVDVTAAAMPAAVRFTLALAFGDVDGDGDTDLVLGNTGPLARRQNNLYLNEGDGTFVDATFGRMPIDVDATQAVALADVDGDRDLDLMSGNAGQNRLFFNDGAGYFGDVTASRLPVDAATTADLALADVDADGDRDIVLGNAPMSDQLYLNDGSGTFVDASAGRMPVDNASTSAVALADVDGDGDADAVLGTSDARNRLYFNDGAGTFVDATGEDLPPDNASTSALALADVDGDGDRDIVAAATMAPSRLLLNDGDGRFADVSAGRMPVESRVTQDIAVGDLDGDGAPEIVLANSGPPLGRQNGLYANDGAGSFTDVTAARLPVDDDWTAGLALGDVDGDGDPDLVLGNSGSPDRLYLNDGTGTFVDGTPGRMPTDFGYTAAVALGDVDGDGDLDLVLARIGLPLQRQNRLLLNDGSGTFVVPTVSRLPTDNDTTVAVALGDVDGDGDLDIVFANPGSQHRLLLNDGAGFFGDVTVSHLPLASEPTSAMALGDVDGDGDLDLVLANTGFAAEAQNRLYLNDGAGVFTDATAARMPVDMESTQAVAFGDVDGDGDGDLVLGNLGRSDRLYRNLRRQLDLPFLARTGRVYRLDAYARYGPPRWADLVLPFVSDTRARTPLPPFGTLALEPSRTIGLPVILLGPGGVGSISFVIPDVPAVVGATVHAQAVLVQYSTETWLTNAAAGVIHDL